MIQDALTCSDLLQKLEVEDKRALTPLIHDHINPYGNITLDLDKRLGIVS